VELLDIAESLLNSRHPYTQASTKSSRRRVDARIESGRSLRHAVLQLIDHERFDRIVTAAATKGSDGFSADDIAWLLDRAPGEIVVLRPAGRPKPAPPPHL
jgi:hypothetical protein